MSVFMVASRAPNSILEKKIAEKYPEDFYKFSANQWFVCAGGTAIDVSRSLEIADPDKNTGGTVGNAVVLALSTYFGFETTDLWDWLKVKWEKNFD